MSTETVIAIIAALGTILGGGGLAGLIANRQVRRAESRTKAAEGEVAQSAEARQWAAAFAAERDRYRAQLDDLRTSHDHIRTEALLCAGGVPCPTRRMFVDIPAPPDPPPAPPPPA